MTGLEEFEPFLSMPMQWTIA